MSENKKVRLSPTPPKQSGSRSLGDIAPERIKEVVNEYSELNYGELEERTAHYQQYVRNFYNLVTDFYEFGWGSSFHFAPRQRGESFKASIIRHEKFISDQLSLNPGKLVLDLGCGVGGPMVTIARHSGAEIVGINYNLYQLERANAITEDVQSMCRFINGDFMNIPVCDDCFDSAYAIEAMVHAPNLAEAFREIFRVLRPGAWFASYEYCLTDKFNPQNPDHMRIKKEMEVGNGLQNVLTVPEVYDAFRTAGFEIHEARDLALESHPKTPWYRALQGRDLSLSSIPRIPFGRFLTNLTLRFGERFGAFPPGTTDVSTFLNEGAVALVEAGETGIFTPMYFFLTQKPPAHGNLS